MFFRLWSPMARRAPFARTCAFLHEERGRPQAFVRGCLPPWSGGPVSDRHPGSGPRAAQPAFAHALPAGVTRWAGAPFVQTCTCLRDERGRPRTYARKPPALDRSPVSDPHRRKQSASCVASLTHALPAMVTRWGGELHSCRLVPVCVRSASGREPLSGKPPALGRHPCEWSPSREAVCAALLTSALPAVGARWTGEPRARGLAPAWVRSVAGPACLCPDAFPSRPRL